MNIDIYEHSKELMEGLKAGAFLTVKSGDTVNTMTIGWGSIGIMWRKPSFTVMVRTSRYTYELLNNTDEFTVSIPVSGKLSKELSVCGSKSGREIDKIKECGLKLKKGIKVNTPVIDGCYIYIECKIVLRQLIDDKKLSPDVNERCYKNGDYHEMYYGEIKAMYINE